MSRKIIVDPSMLRTAAQNMDTHSAEYEKQYKQLFSEVDSLGAAWQGKDNQTFVNQIRGFIQDFEGMTKLMREYSEFLRTSAQTYENTQNDIVAQAKRLAN